MSPLALTDPRRRNWCFQPGFDWISDWVRVSWELVRDENIEAKKDMLDHYPELRGMYDENDDNTEVLYFKNATATISSFTKPPKTFNF